MSNALENLRDFEPTTSEFRAAVIAGLGESQKTLPCKFFYDAEGSRLFDRICELPEYYPTRTEVTILKKRADEIARLVGPAVRLVEFGSGAGVKVRLLLKELERPVGYVPVDISREHLDSAAKALARDFPHLNIAPICADYTKPFELPSPIGPAAQTTVGFFPGSTIGNFTPVEARGFLANARGLLRGVQPQSPAAYQPRTRRRLRPRRVRAPGALERRARPRRDALGEPKGARRPHRLGSLPFWGGGNDPYREFSKIHGPGIPGARGRGRLHAARGMGRRGFALCDLSLGRLMAALRLL